MPRLEVNSTRIRAFDFNKDKEELVVEFIRGDEYVYKKVKPEDFTALLQADSIGKAFSVFEKNHRGVRRDASEDRIGDKK